MEDTGLIFDKLNKLYGLDLVAINNDNDFWIELVRLSYLGIQRGEKSSDFHNKGTRLLEYVLRTEKSNLALLLTETLDEIRIHTKFYLTDNATNLKQLCDLFLIQFKNSKVEIFYNTIKLLNYCEGTLGKANIDAVLQSRIDRMDANIYECFNLALSLELLHTYLIFDKEALKTLFIDMYSDWKHFDGQVNDITFEKLLWYGFLLDNDKVIEEQVTQYSTLIKSDNWGIKFYRVIIKNLSNSGHLDQEKFKLAIKRFNELVTFSTAEKERITQRILYRIENKTKESEKVIIKKRIENNITKEVTRLSPYNLPTGVILKDINQDIIIHLAVYENKNMKKIIKTIRVEALTNKTSKGIYVNKPVLKKIREEEKPGYIHVIDGKKAKFKENKKSKDELFKWPSTDVSSTGTDANNDFNGLNEKSALRKMGYQITNTTKEQRWRILQRAVPDIGLKKVVYTIAGNVKLRIGQRNGANKFSYAISEWQHDLAKLKNKYYKQDFKWPSL